MQTQMTNAVATLGAVTALEALTLDQWNTIFSMIVLATTFVWLCVQMYFKIKTRGKS